MQNKFEIKTARVARSFLIQNILKNKMGIFIYYASVRKMQEFIHKSIDI